MNKTESSLRELLREDASHAPKAGDALGAQIVARVRRERRRRGALGALSAAAVLVAGGWVLGGTNPADIPLAATDSRALPDAGMLDCLPPQSGADIAKLGFAFDGTVTGIGPSSTPDASLSRFAAVTFTVNQWFHGGDSENVTVTMAAPLLPGEVHGEAGPSYQTGTRLLVSGQTEDGEQMLAYGCGYTRYYDPTTSSLWRSATH